ncbi:hypothetical protein BJY01DRAFT_204747 [Aspergillus pseudoustus]|uniref:Secreted protein n=1 Tax=Aspergillus pseudoustus TaxID=1810923 RepID=A0ABR4KRU0_9EURO
MPSAAALVYIWRHLFASDVCCMSMASFVPGLSFRTFFVGPDPGRLEAHSFSWVFTAHRCPTLHKAVSGNENMHSTTCMARQKLECSGDSGEHQGKRLR